MLPLILARATVICAIAWMSAHDAERDGEERLVQLHDEIVELLLSGTKGGEASEEGETKLSAESRRCVQSKIPRAEIEDVDRLSHAQLQTTEQHEERERTISEVSLVVSAAALRCACPPVVLLLAIACSLSLSLCVCLSLLLTSLLLLLFESSPLRGSEGGARARRLRSQACSWSATKERARPFGC